METNRLRQFQTIVSTGNLRKAAEFLGMSHGALSKSMKVLEGELGVKLFQPSGRGIEVTEAGKRLNQRLPDFFHGLDLLTLKEPPRESRVRLATFEVFSTYFMGPFLISLQRSVDQAIRLQCRECAPGELEDLILREEVDLGITYLPIPRPGLRFQKATSVKMGIFTRKEALKSIPLTELPFAVPITPVEGTPSGVKGLDGWPDHLHPRKIAFEVELMETALELCRQGLAAAFLPKFVVFLHNRQVRREFFLEERVQSKNIPSLHRDVYLVARSHSEESRYEKLVARELRMIAAKH